MTYVSTLPEGFEPIERLVLCTNHLRNVPIPIEYKGFPVLLVGPGEIPVVWFGAPVSAAGAEWDFIVEGSSSRNPAVTVNIRPPQREIEVLISNHEVLRARMLGVDSAEVTALNLRPVGLDVVGGPGGLLVGGTTALGNVITNARAAFSFS